jgi:hypothetical protein
MDLSNHFTGTGLIFYSKKNIQYGMKTLDYCMCFVIVLYEKLSSNLTLSMAQFYEVSKTILVVTKTGRYWPTKEGAIAIPLGILGLLISFICNFQNNLIDKRLNFYSWRIVCGVLGYILWLRILVQLLCRNLIFISKPNFHPFV